MKTIYKMLVCALLLIPAQGSFAVSNRSMHKPTAQPLENLKLKQALKLKANSDDIVWVNILQHLVGVVDNGGTYLYHYQIVIDLTHDGIAVSVPSPYFFTLDLDIVNITGQPANGFRWVISSNQSQSPVVDIYSDHELTSSDVVGYDQSAYSYGGYYIYLNDTPIIV